jgi:ABC-2 type transport system ATP-binding protein
MHLQIQALTKTYPGGTQALRGVTLTIPRGIFGLLGPNGAGKSTLMRILATLQEADSGAATLESPTMPHLDLLRDKPAARRVLGYLPQEFGLYPKVTAVHLLDHFAQLKGISHGAERRKLVESLLRQTNLWDARNVRLGAYSGGMKQRFGIAQALIGNPRLIIVDEPTAGLDPEERVRFHNLLGEIGENVIVILSTHIVSDVSDLCRTMAIINRGEVLAAGDPGGLSRELRGRIWQTESTREEADSYRERLAVISARMTAGRRLVRVYAEEQPGAEFVKVEPELEDVYFSTVRRAA